MSANSNIRWMQATPSFIKYLWTNFGWMLKCSKVSSYKLFPNTYASFCVCVCFKPKPFSCVYIIFASQQVFVRLGEAGFVRTRDDVIKAAWDYAVQQRTGLPTIGREREGISFKKHPLSLRKPETVSASRTVGNNKGGSLWLFSKLTLVMYYGVCVFDELNLIQNVDETVCLLNNRQRLLRR